MKNNIFKLGTLLVAFILLLLGCNGSRYAQGDRGDRHSSHHQGVNNRNYRGY